MHPSAFNHGVDGDDGHLPIFMLPGTKFMKSSII